MPILFSNRPIVRVLFQRRTIIIEGIEIQFLRAQLVGARLQIGSRRIRRRRIVIRSNGGVICTCSVCETCAVKNGEKANREKVRSETGTSRLLGQDDIGHPQLVHSFWHSFGRAAKILSRTLAVRT